MRGLMLAMIALASACGTPHRTGPDAAPVSCLQDSSCPGDQPVCGDDGTCRVCTFDTECLSGACALDGSCASETAAVYLDPLGTDVGSCTKSDPCRTLPFGLEQVATGRNHVVFKLGTYDLFGVFVLETATTPVPSLVLHGGGSTLNGGAAGVLTLRMQVTLRDLTLNHGGISGGTGLVVDSIATLERVRIEAYDGMIVRGEVTATDLYVRASEVGIHNEGTLSIERATLRGGRVAIESRGGTLDVTSALVFGAYGVALDLENTTGTIAFSTITDVAASGTGVRCGTPGIKVESSIVWTPAPQTTAVSGSCAVSSSIVGPTGFAGARNVDPEFLAPAGDDFHLSSTSPARDQADSGPKTDFENQPRPQGVRFDLGADETL